MSMNIITNLVKLSRFEQSQILGGLFDGCSATANCCTTATCSCSGEGTCSAEDLKVTCTCQGQSANTVECPKIGG
jgi:hypothetical protein